MRRLALVALLFGACAAPALERPSFAPTDAGTIRVPVDREVTLTGTLTLPRASPAPAVVLMHGCSGITPTHHAWARALRDWGYAALVLDSFTARGVRSTCEAGGLTSEQRVEDAFAALQTLTRHPGIDASRAALMGFSHGGGTVLAAAASGIARSYATPGTPPYRVLIAFYPRCEGRYPGTPLVAPLRVHIGALDDWTPAPPCELMVAALRRAGADARISVYPDSHHGFDSIRQGPPIRLPNVRLYPSGRGATVGPNPHTAQVARDNVRQELMELLARHAQAHQAVLAQHVSPYDAEAAQRLRALADYFASRVGAQAAESAAQAAVYATVVRQAMLLASVDNFRLMAALALCCVPLVWVLRRARAPAGAAAAH